MGMITVTSYTTADAAEISGASYRQLDSWDRLGALVPSDRRAVGSGSRRGYTLHDVVLASILLDLSDLGFDSRAKRRVVDRFRAWWPDLDDFPDEVWAGRDGFLYRTRPQHGLTLVMVRAAAHRDAVTLNSTITD